MIRLTTASTLALALAFAVSGCATDGPASSGDSVRAIVARQVVEPAPQRQLSGVDGAAAAAAYKNYVDSYATPRPQVNDSAFRR